MGCCVVVVVGAVLLAVVGPAFVGDPNATDLSMAFFGPSPGHPLGFDSQGADLLSRLVVGARTAMLGPAIVVLAAMAAATVLAVAAAWLGGPVDAVISTVLDVVFAFPAILLAVLATAVFGAGLAAATVALAIAYTPFIARVLRGSLVRERSLEYIAAAEVQGVTAWAICFRHLIPNVLPLIASQATLVFGYAMVDLAAISFLGLGVQPPQPDWGTMVSTGRNGVLQGYPMESLSAGACIVVVVVAVNLLGERIGDRAAR